MNAKIDRAIVIGASMGGLMAARALADYAGEVIVLDRDELPSGPVPRKSVPQGRHVHAFLDAGCEVLERFFPGILGEMEAEGVGVIDLTRDVAWHHFGVWKVRFEGGLRMLLATRPFLEHHIRERLRALPNVEVRAGVDVTGLLHTVDRSQVTGVRVGDGSELKADLVIDAGGRGSRAPAWLDALGYERPEDEEIGVDLSYTSCLYSPAADKSGDWKFLVEYPRSPDTWRGGFLACVEGDRWLVSLNGYFRDAPELSHEGFLEYARSLPRPELYECLRGATPLTAPVTHKIPTNRFRHFERLTRFPKCFLPMGDSVCAFNPIFGKG